MRLSRLLPHSLVSDIVSLTYQDAVRRRLMTPFIVFVTFLASFAIQRIAAHMLPTVNILIGKYHIHHFYYGMLAVVASSWIALITNREGPRRLAAVLLGAGLGVVADELGLLLTCTSPTTLQCDYHARITWDFFTIIVSFFLSVLYFIPAWKRFKMLMAHTHRLVYGKIR